MQCSTCDQIRKAVNEEQDPLSLLHLIISILMPDAAISADAIIRATHTDLPFHIQECSEKVAA